MCTDVYSQSLTGLCPGGWSPHTCRTQACGPTPSQPEPSRSADRTRHASSYNGIIYDPTEKARWL